MSAAWILAPIAVMASSLIFIDARQVWMRALGFVLLFGGLVGVGYVLTEAASRAEEDVARCASRGGVPANGDCYINGERR